MTFSMKRFQAIVNKEWKDALKNPQLLLMVVMPIMFSVLFSKMGSDRAELISFPLMLALSMTGAFVQAMTIAEEKEKHTLRVLMLSPAKTSEILMGKSMLTVVMTVFVAAVSIIVADMPLYNLPAIALLFTMSLVMFISLGTIIGLLSRSVQESSIVGLPILIIFLMGPMYAPLMGNDTLTAIVKYLPTEHFTRALVQLSEGAGLADIGQSLLVHAVWMVGSLILCVFVYSRKRFDK
ncbi:ABC transporter permease [Paenibacillus marinisediminis]